MKKMRLNTPLSDKTVRNLHIGDQMWIRGEVICARIQLTNVLSNN